MNTTPFTQSQSEAEPSQQAGFPSLLVDIAQLCVLLSRSRASLFRDDAAGRLPRALKIGGAKRWRYEDIAEWVRQGCPDRRTFEARQAAQGNGRPR